MSEKAKDTPQGVLAVLVGPDGREVANAASFQNGTVGGFSNREFNERLARDLLSRNAMRKLASPLLSEAIDQYQAGKIMAEMCEQGCRVIIVPIGYE